MVRYVDAHPNLQQYHDLSVCLWCPPYVPPHLVLIKSLEVGRSEVGEASHLVHSVHTAEPLARHTSTVRMRRRSTVDLFRTAQFDD